MTPTYSLRHYQLEAVNALWGHLFKDNSALCVLPTGAGKTRIMTALVDKTISSPKELVVAVLMGRVDLVSQTEKVFREFLNPNLVGVWCGSLGRKEINKVIVTSIQSADVTKLPVPNLIIIDEVHRLNQESGSYSRFIKHTMKENPKAKLVGFTATPFRESGLIYGENKTFKEIVYRKTMVEMISLGFLVPPVLKGSENEFDVSKLRVQAGEYRQDDVDALVRDRELCELQVKDALKRMIGRQTVAWACANIEHCNMVADVIMNYGETVTTVHSKLNKYNREKNLGAFLGGQVNHVSFVSILSEGFDYPPIDCIVLMRPTRSPALYVQTVGRGLRPSRAKPNCLVLDYGQVIKTLGPLDNPRIHRTGRNTLEDAIDDIKECPKCHTYIKCGVPECTECSYEWPKKPIEPPPDKLDRKAYFGGILSKDIEPEVYKSSKAHISLYTSKKGNECIKITYLPSDLVSTYSIWGLSEYFSVKHQFAMDNYRSRLRDLHAEPTLPWVAIGPFEVTKKHDGQYERILTVKHLNPPVDDTSFDFGFNTIEQQLDWTKLKQSEEEEDVL